MERTANDFCVGLVEVVSLMNPPTNASNRRVLRIWRVIAIEIIGGGRIGRLGSPDEHSTVTADSVYLIGPQWLTACMAESWVMLTDFEFEEK